MVYKINKDNCISCGTCAGICPVAAISPKDGKYFINPTQCISCGTCATVCPVAAIAVDPVVMMKPTGETGGAQAA